MNCPSCKRENPADSLFCESCGAKLEAKCPACAAAVSPGANFCRKCGHAISGTVPLSAGEKWGQSQGEGQSPFSPAPSLRSVRDYTPKHLADKILTSKSALEGERKQVTVLFADVKGSMDLAEQVDPEAWHKILNRFFEILTDGVHRFEGTVNQYTGDGIMALFGAPIAHEDHAHRACYAALHLSEALRAYANQLRVERELSFSVRMGLNSGDVIVGKIGDDLRMDYTAQGHTVGLAARMEQLAEPGKAFLTGHTASLVTGFFQMEELGPMQAKGAREPVRVFELQGVGPMRTRLDVSRARGLTRFVGREQEMATLEAALSSALEGSGRVVGLMAEPGTGKSRLSFELAERCRARGIRVREAQALAHGKSIPFLPILEFLRDFFGVTERDTDEEARHKMAGRVLLLDEAVKEELPILFDFLGVPDPKRPSPMVDPEARQKRLIGLVRRIIQARSREEPAVVLFEDMHWIDPGSEAFIESIMETVAGTRTLLLLTFRPEYRAEWMTKTFYQQIPLLPLGPEAIAEMLRDLLGADPSVANLCGRVAGHTGGNPFFVEEIVQSLAEAGGLEGRRGAYRQVGSLESLTLPPTVRAVLAARIDRLAEREKQLLNTAAVIGKRFAEGILKQVANLPDMDLASALHALMRAEFIYQESLYPEAEYAFKHPLTQEVAYGSQLADTRRQVHAAVAGAIEALKADKLDEHAALLAHHWENAGEPMPAARAHRRAALWAAPKDAVEAARHWGRIRELLGSMAESKESLDLRIEACGQIMLLSARMGGVDEEIGELVDEAKDLAARSEAPASKALVFILYGYSQTLAGHVAEAEAAFEQARGPLADAKDANLAVDPEIRTAC